MANVSRLLAVIPFVAAVGCININPPTVVERRLERAFKVAPGAVVRVDLLGGSVTTITGPEGVVELVVYEEARTTRGERAADNMLASIDLAMEQQGDEVRLIQRRSRTVLRSQNFWHERIQVRATVTLPASTRLDLNTRGGKIALRGERTADVRARTSGGSISAEGGVASMLLGTSGGSINVSRALGVLQADTSGGSISVDYVGPTASRIELGTSGGSIRVGIDPGAALTVMADTRGGSVRIEELEFDGHAARRSHMSGTLNGGQGGSFRASTSGGNITVSAASDPRLPARRGDSPVRSRTSQVPQHPLPVRDRRG